MVYLNLLWAYLKIGLFGFGGGYAMLSLIQHEAVEVVHYGESAPWLTSKEFTDIVAISQMTPGPIGINSATYIGYVATGGSIWGSILATTAVCLPSFILVLLVSHLLLKHKDNLYIQSIFSGLRPVVVGLIASAALILMNKENFPDYLPSVLIAVVSFLLVRYTKIHPIWVIVLAGIAGYIIY
ncbi:chromate transporter [Coprobacter tertius]|uniref:Chromate transporter n=1 Tax=Coprobacter tertius TaxID=2944915 RepID=A0ABT1MF67_9BACT|nr:chromate transporter [Coprobacter tertius]